MNVRVLWFVLLLASVLPAVVLAADAGTAVTPGTTAAPAATCPQCDAMAMTPANRAQMMAMTHDLLVMSQNTAAWTPQGLVVLQGNRLLAYSPDFRQVRQIALPLPTPTTTAATTTTPETGTARPMATMPLRSMVTSRLIQMPNGGLLVVRGQQIIQLDPTFRPIAQVMLPDLPPISAEEMAAVCPLCSQMQMMAGMMAGMAASAATMMPMTGTASAGQTTPAY